MGYTVFGLTGRNDNQKTATVGNLDKVGYTPFAAQQLLHEVDGVGTSQQPSYITCVDDELHDRRVQGADP